MNYEEKQSYDASAQLEKQADAILAQADQAENESIIKQAKAILKKMDIHTGSPINLEEAKTVVESFHGLERIESILYGRDEAKQAAEAVIASNPLYSEIFTPEQFLKLAVSYAVAQTYSISLNSTSVDEILAIRDIQEGRFGKEYSKQIRSKERAELEELAEQGKIPSFEYIEFDQKTDKSTQ